MIQGDKMDLQNKNKRIENPCVGGSIPSLGTTTFSAENKGFQEARCNGEAPENHAISPPEQGKNISEPMANMGHRIASEIISQHSTTLPNGLTITHTIGRLK